MEEQTQLTKKERKELNRQEKIGTKEAEMKSRHAKKVITRVGWGTFGVAVVAGLIWLVASAPKTPEGDILSRNGFHWHPEVTIYVKGEKQEIPANIGIGAVHQPIHTHDDSNQGIVHMEFQGLVRKENATLGQFLKSWGKDINSFGTNVKMTVNGEENTELETYVMQDKDKIELRYE
ncbi:hypothetical protein C4568_01125 [Candidatus Parcubacteria bacterium]|nr:MAG: hypothetical protein C4568_01125 [Candidatus Parcubacteria bacterium]